MLDVDVLAAVAARHRGAGRTVVLTNGCFDLLHAGHVGYLTEAARLGDVLVVAVNSDASVRRLKGPSRPITALADRLAVLAGLRCVDHVVPFEEDTPLRVLDAVRPQVYVKGGDYAGRRTPETERVRAWGGRAVTVDLVPAASTTQTIARIRALAATP